MYVYWIKRDCHTDPKTEGYIGVTNKSLEERFRVHSKYVKKRSHVNKAIQKYDDVDIVLLHEGTDEECLRMEHNLRPKENIGWNIAKGGSVPPMMNEETARKIAQTLKGRKRSAESIEKQRQTMLKKRFLDSQAQRNTCR